MIDIGNDCVAARVPCCTVYSVYQVHDYRLSLIPLDSKSSRVRVCIKAEINWLYVGLPNALFTFVYACHRFDCRLSMPSLSFPLSLSLPFAIFVCFPVRYVQLSVYIFVHFFLHNFFCTLFFGLMRAALFDYAHSRVRNLFSANVNQAKSC